MRACVWRVWFKTRNFGLVQTLKDRSALIGLINDFTDL